MIKYWGIFTVIRRPRAEMFCTEVIDWLGGGGALGWGGGAENQTAWGPEIIEAVGKPGRDRSQSWSIKRLPACGTISMHS